jgi:pilus assembly protein CpaE
MPLDEAGPMAFAADTGRPDRAHCLAYVNDSATEAALQEGMAEMQGALEVNRGGIKAAIAAMQRLNTPRVLIVDIGGEESPLAALEALSDVVEPHVCVLVVGDLKGLDFYREVTRGVGAAEYLAKPLSREMVARHFGPLAQGRAPTGDAALGGRMITVTGVRGGSGASTVAVNLAWHFGCTARRHTVLLDPDTHFGTASFLLNVEPGTGLATALQTPDRIDTLLAERAAEPVDDRLHVLAGQERLDVTPEHAPDAAGKLLDALRRRYNFIVADVPYRPLPLYRDLLAMSHRRVLVMEPTLAAVRDALRLIALPAATSETPRPVVVLNRLNRPGSLGRRQIEDALQSKVDVVIPDLPKIVSNAATFGKPAVAAGGAFRDAIVELSRQVAFSRLLDSANYFTGTVGAKKTMFGRLRKARA